MTQLKLVISLLLFVLFMIKSAEAQNYPVVNNISGSQKTIRMITDDSETHILMVWEDNRNSSQDIYMQSMDILFAPMWTLNGIPVCNETGTQETPDMCTDGSGGVFVVWSDKRGATWDIYAQHIDAGGNALWTLNGNAVCTATGIQRNPKIISDSTGGCIIGWEDNRGGNYDIYTQRMDVNGNPLWTANGISVCGLNGAQDDLDMAVDGLGGAIYVWSDARGPNRDVYAERFDGNGTSLWQTDGKLICDNSAVQDETKVVFTGNNDVYFVWTDASFPSGPFAIYGARYYLNGTLTSGFGSGTTGIFLLSEYKLNGNDEADRPVPIPDYRGGIIVCGESGYQSGDNDVSAQRVDSTGNLLWNISGGHVRISYSVDNDRFADITPDRTGGFFAVWRKDGGGNGDDIYTRHFNCDGITYTSYLPVCLENGNQNFPHIVSIDSCAYMAWEDPRPGSAGLDIWMDKYCLACNTPQIIFSATMVNCNGGNDGTVLAMPSSPNSCIDSAMFQYAWSIGNQTTQLATGLSAGTYYVTVTDVFGCTNTDSITITEPAALTAVLDTVSPLCNGDNNGTIVITPSGGTSPYNYNWSSGQTDSSATGLSAGIYYITITDNNGCTLFDTVTLVGPSVVSVLFNSSDVSCFGYADGQVLVSVNGGTSPYSYSWSTGDSVPVLTGLSPGLYYLTVTDSNGCIGVDTLMINEPAMLISSVSSTDVLCAGNSDGTASVNPSGGSSPYQYFWSNSAIDSTVTGLLAGTYYVTITDNNGCTTTDSTNIAEPPAIVLTLSGTDASCYGKSDGSAVISVNGGISPYLYNWSNGGTSANQDSLSAGVYQLTLTDANGCTMTQSITINQPSAIEVDAKPDTTISAGESVQLIGEGGPFWLWTPATSLSCSDCQNPVATPEETTTYYLTVIGDSGCSATDSVTIVVEDNSDFFIPNIFSPNGDGHNDILYVRGKNISNIEYVIYDRWGNKMFESHDVGDGWEGTYNGKPVNAGVYVWYVKFSLDNKEETIKKGSVSLVR